MTLTMLLMLGELTDTLEAELASLAPGGGMGVAFDDSKSSPNVPALLCIFVEVFVR